MTYIYVGFAFAGLFILYFTFGFRFSGSHSWKESAQELGLSYDKETLLDDGGMSGTYNGMQVKVRGSGKPNHSKYKGRTRYEVTSSKVPPGFAFTEEGDLAKLQKFFGHLEDVEVGLPVIDGAFVIRAHDPANAREIFRRDGVESVLLELRYKTTTLELHNGTLVADFDEGHVGHAVSAYLAKLTGLMEMLAQHPSSWPGRESPSEGDSDDAEADAEPAVNEEQLQDGWW